MQARLRLKPPYISTDFRPLISKSTQMKSIRKYIFTPILIASTFAGAQNSTDSLTLQGILSGVMQNYPALIKAQKDMESADAKIELSKTSYLPDVNFTGSFNYLGPVNSLSMPGLGAFDLYPHHNYSAAVTISESIYDFGKTNKNVTIDQNSKEMVRLSVEQTKQRISGAAVANFYSISFLQQAINIKNDQLKNLNEHLTFVQKRAATGSATNYDILTTKVRISNTENQITDLQAALQVQTAQLNTLMGNPASNKVAIKNEMLESQNLMTAESLLNEAYNNRSELKIAHQKENLTLSKLDAIGVQNNPSLMAFATGGFKNGYFNDEFHDVGKLNYVVGISLKVPLFDANRSKYQKTIVNAEVDGNRQETELAKRSITNEVFECKANTDAARKKVAQSELQLQQATQAYELANINYNAGTITNLDLLDSYNALSESKLALFKTKIDYSLSIQRMKIALGEKLY